MPDRQKEAELEAMNKAACKRLVLDESKHIQSTHMQKLLLACWMAGSSLHLTVYCIYLASS